MRWSALFFLMIAFSLSLACCNTGTIEDDAGVDDAGEDAGLDAGDPGLDAGDPGLDAGDPGLDAGDPGVDAGDPGVDAGDPGVDAGDPGVDGGDPGPGDGDAMESDGDGAPADEGPECVVVDDPDFYFEVTDQDPARKIPLQLEDGVEYRTLHIEFEFNPTAWSPTCYNPAVSRYVAAMNTLTVLRRGYNYCRGGNFFWSILRGPPQMNSWVRSFYRPDVVNNCNWGNMVETNVIPLGTSHHVQNGQFYQVTIDHDFTTQEFRLQIGNEVFTGTNHDEFQLISTPQAPLVLVLSFDEWMECYDSNGNHDPDEPCCWPPSIGWIYRNFHYSACR